LLIVSPDSLGTACPQSGRNSTYRPVQISAAGSLPEGFDDLNRDRLKNAIIFLKKPKLEDLKRTDIPDGGDAYFVVSGVSGAIDAGANADRISAVRSYLTSAQPKANSENVLRWTNRYIESADPFLRRSAVVALYFERQNPLAVRQLIAALKSDKVSFDTKIAAIRALEQAGSASALEPLRQLAEDAKIPKHLQETARFAIANLESSTKTQFASSPPQNIFSGVNIKTTNLGDNTYMLEGRGGNITVAVGTDGIIMVDTQFAPLHDKIKAAIEKISPLPIKYVINTHFHGDHTGGNASFHKDGTTIVAQDNIRLRLVAGSTNGLTGQRSQPQPADAIPTDTYLSGTKKVSVGSRIAEVNHVTNAHTDGDSWVYFRDANVVATGDIVSRNYPNLDWGSGGSINGMINAVNLFLKTVNGNTKIVPGHGPLATKANLEEYRDMLVTARDRIRKLRDEGKTEDQVVAAKPLADFDAKWAATPQAAGNFVRNIYNSFNRS
jgi:cyclase